MSYGEGSITEKLKPNGKSYSPKRWRVCLSYVVQVEEDGQIKNKRKKVQRIVEGTKAEAKALRDKLKQDYDGGLSLKDDQLTFDVYANQWHDKRVLQAEVGKARLDREKSIVNDLASVLSGIRLQDMTPQTVDAAMLAIKKRKQAEGHPISNTTLNMGFKVLKQVLKNAVDYDLILRNPCDRVKAPKIDAPERKSLEASEAARLLGCVDREEDEAWAKLEEKEARQAQRGKNENRKMIMGLNDLGFIQAVRIGLATGMRRGEVFALTWKYADLDAGKLRVAASLTVYDEVKAPKSRAGYRVISIDAATCERLRDWKERQAVELKKLRIVQGPDTPVCCSATGTIAKLAGFERWWRAFRERNDFGDLKFHELCYTQATQLLANGIDVKTVQTRLGHSNASLTLNQYAHAIPENDEHAAALVGQLYALPEEEDYREEERASA